MIRGPNAVKHFCSNAVLLSTFHLTDDQNTRVIRLCEVEGRNMHDQIVFCAFHSFLVEVQMTAGDACEIHCNNLETRIASDKRSLQ